MADMYREIQEDAMCAIQEFFFSRLWKFNELLELKGSTLIMISCALLCRFLVSFGMISEFWICPKHLCPSVIYG